MRVRRDFPLQLIRLVNEGFQLFVRVLRCPNGVAFRQHAASCARLDHVSAILDLITNGSANLIWSIGDALFDSGVEKSRAKAILIAVAATHSDGMTGAHHARSRRPAFVDRLSQSH